MAPDLSLAAVRVVISAQATGFPVLRTLPLCTCCRHYPGAAAGRTLRSTSPSRISLPRKGCRVGLRIVLFEMLWGGGEEIASIVADVTDGGPNAKAERPEPIPYRPETGQHTDRGDRNEFVELARCRHRAWRRASAVEEACSRRVSFAESSQTL